MPLITTYKAKPPRGFSYPTCLSELNQHCPSIEGQVGFHFHATSTPQWERSNQTILTARFSPGIYGGYYAKKGSRPAITLSVTIYALPLDAIKRYRADLDRAKSALCQWMSSAHSPHERSHFITRIRNGVISIADGNWSDFLGGW